MGGVEDMIKEAVRSKNKPTIGSPNEITKWYAERNGRDFRDSQLWCNMGITFWAFHSGNYAAVCFNTDFAATKFHSNRFKEAGQWHDGAAGIRRGDIIFFTREDVVGIGHIGLVHTVESSNLITVEANTSDAVRFRTHPRASGKIVGYGRPDYTQEDDMTERELIDVLRVAFAGDKDKPVREWAKQLDQVKAQLAEIQHKLDQINP